MAWRMHRPVPVSRVFNYPLVVSMQDPVNKAPVAWKTWNFTVQRQFPGR